MTLQDALVHATWWAYLVCLGYLAAITALFLLMLVVAAVENRVRAFETRLEDFDTLLESPFTIPVSIIAPAYNEEVCVTAAVSSLLALSYPEYEVILVNDGSGDGTLDRLQQDFDLKPIGTFYRKVLPASEVRQLYRSARDPRLTVIDKVNGGKADALNCGINLARYRYVCCVDGDTVYHPDALLKGMRLAIQDPARVLGVTSQIGLSSRPELSRQADGRVRVDRNLLTAYQVLDYLRAFVSNRLAWSRWNYMLCTVGAFAIWRRDVVLELGGFSSDFTCEDIEFTFRVHERFRRTGTPYRIHSLPDTVGITEGPNTIARLVSQRARWQRVIIETVWHYRRMLGNRRYGTVGLVGMPYYVLAEVLAPIVQVLALLTIPLAAASGLLRWDEFARFLAVLALGSAVFTNAAILLQDRTLRSFAASDLPFLILIGPFDLFLYRPIIFYAQFKGFVDFLRGDRSWHKFARNRR
jgi:cellulose synthase/poly-beta-1,6-N-acetylglucosamine synthase-like glycosyltransferase